MSFNVNTSSVSRRRGLPLPKMNDITRYLYKYRKVLGVIAVVAFVFYWYEIRPVSINNTCVTQAGSNARSLLQTKAQISTDPSQRASFQNMINQNLYMRSDYESFYTKCLGSYGIF
jgi:hypothetical protein